ncbi:hypothetical protein PM082_008415 [Marasmius tenuissimus]|nr:hypothetical protein PM082_008415 [Marasmius tenuissimus]
MFASLRLGAVARLARTPVSMSLLGVRPLSTPAIIRRTFLTSSRVNEPTTSKASETKDKATKTTTKKTSAKKPPRERKLLRRKPRRLSRRTNLGDLKSRRLNPSKYSQQYTGELREWTQRYAEWYNRLTPEQLKAVRAIYRKKSVRLSKPAGQPTRPPAPFLSFYTEYKKQRPELTVVEASKQSAKAWNELPQATREGYQQRYYAAKEQYVKDLENYKQSFA